MSGLSGWCSPAFGTCESEKAHGICETRRRDAGVKCDCDNFGGHETRADEPDSLAYTIAAWENGGANETAPGGALTPDSQGLADYQGVD